MCDDVAVVEAGVERGQARSSRYLVLLGAVIVQLLLGTVYGYSIFWQPLTATIFPPVAMESQRAVFEAEGLDVTGYTFVVDEVERQAVVDQQQGYLKYAFSICLLSFASMMVIAGRVQDVTGPRLPAVIGAVLMGSGFLVAGFMSHPIVFYLAHAAFTGVIAIVVLMVFHALLGDIDVERMPIVRYVPMGIVTACVVAGLLLGDQYVGRMGEMDRLFVLWGTVGFLAGSGIGFAYVCPIAALVKWFPNQKGLVTGLAVAGFGFGAFLFKDPTIGAFAYIKQYDILSFFVVHGLVCLVGVSAGAMLLRNPPERKVSQTEMKGTGSVDDDSGESSWQDTLRRPAFYVLWLMFFSGAMAGLMVIGIVKVFAGEQLVAAAGEAGELTGAARQALLDKGVEAVGWLAIFNAVGRVLWGVVSDRIGRTIAFVVMFLLQAVVMCVLATMDTEVSLAIAASLIGFNFGGNFALFPSATADLFGTRNLGANYGWVFTSYGIAGVAGIAAGNFARTTGSYAAAFYVAAVLCVVSAGLAIGLHVQQRRGVGR